MITQSFDLNMIPDSEPVIVHVNQYDEGSGRFAISLYNGTSLYSPSNATVKVQGTKPDKKGFQYDASISGSTVTVNLEKQMTAVPGDVRTQIVVTESNGKTGTFVFIMKVQESALEDDTDISETVLPDIIDAAETNAERAETAARDAQAWASHSPYIDPETYHWWVWDGTRHQFVDTGINADGNTTSYNSLEDKPTVEGNTIVGNKTADQLGLARKLRFEQDYLVI